MINLIVKGYDIETKNQSRLLHEFVSEYGINLSHKENTDIFKASMKPRSNLQKQTKTKKR